MKFHYSRKERLAMSNAPRLDIRHRKGVFRGNRSLLIVLLDVLLICLMFFLFKNFVFKPRNRIELSGYAVALRCRVIKDSVYAAVRIKEENAETGAERAFVEFRFGDGIRQNSVVLSPGERTSYEVTALLPFPSAEENHADLALIVTVRMGDEEKTMKWIPDRVPERVP
jgi:hypothetical protein